MHDYSIDNHPKEKILFLLAFVAISAAPWLNRIVATQVERLNAATGLSWAPVTAIPVFALFLALYWLFNNRLWKHARLRRLLLVPDLNGTWRCEGTTVLRDGVQISENWTAQIIITQSWSKISIVLLSSKSESKSVAASAFHEPGVGYRLLYHYRNAPSAGQDVLRIHDGAAELVFSEDCTSARGNYFTDRHRRTVGIMILQKA